jgi:integrase
MFLGFLKEAELPPMRLHDLRQSAATILLSQGVNAKVVQEILGHSRITMTLGIYGQVLPGMQGDAMNKWDEWF